MRLTAGALFALVFEQKSQQLNCHQRKMDHWKKGIGLLLVFILLGSDLFAVRF